MLAPAAIIRPWLMMKNTGLRRKDGRRQKQRAGTTFANAALLCRSSP
jgi:hypothetical protein